MARYDRRTVIRGTGLALAAALAGCGGDGGATATQTQTATETQTATSTPSLGIEHVTFVTERPTGYRQYTEASDRTYRTGEPIWVYFEPTGVATESAGEDEVRFSLTTTLTIRGPEGGAVDTLSQDVSQTVAESRDLSELYLFWNFDVGSDNPAGAYTGEISVTDDLSGKRAGTTVSFTLGSQESDFQETFRSVITSELEVRIRSLATSDGTVELVYRTAEPADSQPSQGQIGYVAGAYAGLVDAGWDTDQLRVEFVDGNDERYRWSVEATTAQAFIDDDITQDEFATRVFDTVTRVDV